MKAKVCLIGKLQKNENELKNFNILAEKIQCMEKNYIFAANIVNYKQSTDK